MRLNPDADDRHIASASTSRVWGIRSQSKATISGIHEILMIFNGAPAGLVSGLDLIPAPDVSTVSINMAENTGTLP